MDMRRSPVGKRQILSAGLSFVFRVGVEFLCQDSGLAVALEGLGNYSTVDLGEHGNCAAVDAGEDDEKYPWNLKICVMMVVMAGGIRSGEGKGGGIPS